MKNFKEIEADNKKSHDVVKKIVKKAIAENIKDGSSVYVKTWTPKKGWHFARHKFNYYHKLHGLYPNVSDKIGATGNLAQNNYVIKKTLTSKEINF